MVTVVALEPQPVAVEFQFSRNEPPLVFLPDDSVAFHARIVAFAASGLIVRAAD